VARRGLRVRKNHAAGASTDVPSVPSWRNTMRRPAFTVSKLVQPHMKRSPSCWPHSSVTPKPPCARMYSVVPMP
jgi:hypothetical protein